MNKEKLCMILRQHSVGDLDINQAIEKIEQLSKAPEKCCECSIIQKKYSDKTMHCDFHVKD